MEVLTPVTTRCQSTTAVEDSALHHDGRLYFIFRFHMRQKPYVLCIVQVNTSGNWQITCRSIRLPKRVACESTKKN